MAWYRDSFTFTLPTSRSGHKNASSEERENRQCQLKGESQRLVSSGLLQLINKRDNFNFTFTFSGGGGGAQKTRPDTGQKGAMRHPISV
jgi:hypothetical protein